MPSIFNRFEYLFDDFRVQGCTAMEGDRYSQTPLPIDTMASSGTEEFEAAPSSARSASVAVQRSSLGIHFDGRRQNLLAEQIIAFVARQRLEVELDCLSDIGHCLLDRFPLRLASLQFGAPSVETVLVFLDYDARLCGSWI